jgi:glycosyltransferase involved in cell wall biosynthesis
MTSNFFSIAIPTYGYGGMGSNFLSKNLSVLTKQAFKDFEVVISDHSTDDTILEVADSFSKKLDIKYVRNDVGRGIISPNINKAIEYCEGEYIKILFQDDFLYDEYSLLCIAFHIMREGSQWYMSRFVHSNDGESFYREMTPKWTNDIYLGNNLLGCPSGFVGRARHMQGEIEFDDGLNFYMDCDYYMKWHSMFGEPNVIPYITHVNRTWGARLTDTIQQDQKSKELEVMIRRWGKSQ